MKNTLVQYVFAFAITTILIANISANDNEYNFQEFLVPIKKFDVDSRKVQLGKRLFVDKRLSKENSVSCASCHDLKKCGVDNLPLSKGFNDLEGEMNSPSVFNAAFNFAQFWDGRAANLKEQIEGPIHKSFEMATNFPEIIAKLNKDKNYLKEFNDIYGDGINENNIKNAIVEFEKSLPAPTSKFDQYLLGNESLSADESKGLELFQSLGCIACHQGMGIGGGMYQKIGIMIPYYDRKKMTHDHDFGRYNVTKDEEDISYFKVPSLRNVVKTSPYFHDGAIKTLDEAIHLMGKHQLGRELDKREIESIKAFLGTLTQKECQ